MKIGISSTAGNEKALTDPRFGRCETFALVDTETNAFRFVENAAKSAGGGAGIAGRAAVARRGRGSVCTGNLGPNAFRVLNEAGIKAYRVSEMPLSDAVKRFKEGALDPIDEAGRAHAGMRGGPNA
jgi:predicted Fe-Mo cluster-binding NifX family protein